MIGMLYCPVLTFLHCVLDSILWVLYSLLYTEVLANVKTWIKKNNKRNIANALCYDYCQSKSSKINDENMMKDSVSLQPSRNAKAYGKPVRDHVTPNKQLFNKSQMDCHEIL